MKHIKSILAVWGAISGIILIGASVYIAFEFTIGNADEYDTASNNDVRFVLNWCELGDDRIESVLHSYESSHSLTGDHLDAYAIKITHANINELETPSQDYIKWTRGDKLQGVLKQSVDLVSSFVGLDELAWFPSKGQLSSSEFYVNSWSILLHGERPTAVKLIFVNPSNNIVYYASVKT